MRTPSCFFSSFFFNDTATTEIYTLSLHDALPISIQGAVLTQGFGPTDFGLEPAAFGFPHFHTGLDLASKNTRIGAAADGDRKSTRLNSSHSQISYAVFCLKKKNNSREPAEP